jgi:cyclomaltodextrinase / maltogenic alpha-amylase / neopullulanase
MPVPAWVQDAIFYQVFPDRFANGDKDNDPPNIVPWESEPTNHSFHGGDLRGIINNLGYLLDLGITAIYLNPIFLSPSNHRYNVTDYFQIDPKLGTMQDFHDLIRLAHQFQVKLILDGAFNHCGRGFFAFSDILENQEFSPYTDWFHIRKFPIDAYSPLKTKSYDAWWGFKSLPKFNTSNPRVRDYLMKAGEYWIEQGADGWRLDVPNEIADNSFWDEFRQRIKKINPEAYLVGEIWVLDNHWVGEKTFDGLMNYPCRDTILGLVNGALLVEQFTARIEEIFNAYPLENLLSMYSLLGSHDIDRVLTVLNGDLDKVKLAYLFQFAFPGTPAIYYGDEIGMTGGKDPQNRAAFRWDENTWNQNLRSWLKKLIQVRKQYRALRSGAYQSLPIQNNQSCCAFIRVFENERMVCVFNLTPESQEIRIGGFPIEGEEGLSGISCLSGDHFQAENGELSIRLGACAGEMIVLQNIS